MKVIVNSEQIEQTLKDLTGRIISETTGKLVLVACPERNRPLPPAPHELSANSRLISAWQFGAGQESKRDTFHDLRYTRLRRAHLRRGVQKTYSKSACFCLFLPTFYSFLLIFTHF